jgi:hypothetical protein
MFRKHEGMNAQMSWLPSGGKIFDAALQLQSPHEQYRQELRRWMVKRGNIPAVCIIVASVFAMWATPAFAYLGPGAGLSAIGAFLALIIGVIVAFLGFIWYPLKRFLRKGKAAGAAPSAPQQPQATSSHEGL